MEINNSGPDSPRWREREAERCRDAILGAAVELFARHGYGSTSMKQIADRVKISVGKLYNHFKGKEEIYQELMQRHMNGLHVRSTDGCSTDDPPMAQLRCRITKGFEYFKEHRDFMAIYHRENPLDLSGMISEQLRRNRDTVAVLFAKAIERGDIPEEAPDILAIILMGAGHALLDVLLERRGAEAFDEVPEIIDRLILRPLEARRHEAKGMEDH